MTQPSQSTEASRERQRKRRRRIAAEQGREIIPPPAAVDGSRLRALRTSQQLTQGMLAQRAGTSMPAISRMENGRGKAQLSTIAAVARVLGAHPESLLLRTNGEQSK